MYHTHIVQVYMYAVYMLANRFLVRVHQVLIVSFIYEAIHWNSFHSFFLQVSMGILGALQRVVPSERLQREDEDAAFFTSLLTTVGQLPPELKRQTKLKLLTLANNALIESLQSPPSSQLPQNTYYQHNAPQQQPIPLQSEVPPPQQSTMPPPQLASQQSTMPPPQYIPQQGTMPPPQLALQRSPMPPPQLAPQQSTMPPPQYIPQQGTVPQPPQYIPLASIAQASHQQPPQWEALQQSVQTPPPASQQQMDLSSQSSALQQTTDRQS